MPILVGMMIERDIRGLSHRLLGQLAGGELQDAAITCKPLTGGTEASGVTLITARYRDDRGRARMLRFVSKELHGRPAREAAVYEHLVNVHARDLAPRLLAVERVGPDAAFLFLEAIRRANAWPWRDISKGSDLLVRLAQFHMAADGAATTIPEWDYEGELSALAEATRTVLDQCRKHPDLSVLARDVPRLDRIILARPRIRQQLLSEQPFGCRPIHGDVHPGNALVCRRGRGDETMLIDWGRARLGSPLEDVSSWLQSLGYWEPEGRRFHDTLLATYLAASGMERRLTSSIRGAYWMAGASNVLSGALHYHLCIARDERQTASRRSAAFRAAADCLRVIRRAHAWWM